MKPYNYLILLFLIFLGCTKEELQDESYTNLPLPKGIFYDGRVDTFSYPFYMFPCINPNNSDEFIFYEKTRRDTVVNGIQAHYVLAQAFVYNWKTQEKILVFTGAGVQSRFRWSRKDWIVFARRNGSGNDGYNIWKMKSDGDSLTRLTVGGVFEYPEWNYSGDRILYSTFDLASLIMTENGVLVDSSEVYGGAYCSWQHDSLLISSASGLVVANPLTNEWSRLLRRDETESFLNKGGAEWIDDETVVWSNAFGLYQTNITTNETVLVRQMSDASYYSYFSYSRLLKKLLLFRRDTRITDSENYMYGEVKSTIVMMNPDGTGEEVIEIPE